MKTKLAKIMGVALTLVLLVSVLISAIPAAAGTLQYTNIGTPSGPIPFNIVRTGVNLNVFAQAPDGKTMFVYDNVNNVLLRSTNSGTWWSTTNIGVGLPAGVDLVDLVVSSSYATDTTVVAATAAGVFRSINGGSTFGPVSAVVLPAGSAITSVDITDYFQGGQAMVVSYANPAANFTNGGVGLFTMTGLAWADQRCVSISSQPLKLVVSTAIDAANPATVTVTYVDQSGNAAEAAVAVVIPAGSAVGTEVAVGLVAPDTAARDVTLVATTGSTATTGAFYVVGETAPAGVGNSTGTYASYTITGAATGTFSDVGVGHTVDVLDVAFSPLHKADALMVAVTTDTTNTYLQYKMGTEAWGATIQTATYTGGVVATYPNAAYGTVVFPADYEWSSNNRVLVGLGTPGGVTAGDDVYVVTGGLAAGSSQWRDLNIYGVNTNTSVKSLALKGNYVGGKMLVGTYTGGGNGALVYSATDPSIVSGVAWTSAVKQPIGSYTIANTNYALVAFSATGDDAYAMTGGAFAAFSKSVDGGITWNGISMFNIGNGGAAGLAEVSLIDFRSLDSKVMYAIMYDDANNNNVVDNGDFSMLIKSTNGGTSWEQVWSWRTVNAERLTYVGISPGYAKDNTVFVAQNDTRIWKSSDGGKTFIGLTSPGTNIRTFYAVDASTYYTGASDTSGQGILPAQGFYKSGRWSSPTLTSQVNDIALTPDGKAIFIGYTNGSVGKSVDDGMSFAPYGIGLPPTGGAVNVAIDPDGKTVYATTSAVASSAIWRIADTPGALWTNIDNTAGGAGVASAVGGNPTAAVAADAITATFVAAANEVLVVTVLPGSAITVAASGAGNPTIAWNPATTAYTITTTAGVANIVVITNANATGPANAILTTPVGNTGAVTFSTAAPGSDLDADVPAVAATTLGVASTRNLALPDAYVPASTGNVNVTPIAMDVFAAKNGTLYVAVANWTGANPYSGGGLRRSVNPKGATAALRGFETIGSAVGFDLPATATGLGLRNVENNVFMLVGSVPAALLGASGYASLDATGLVGARIVNFNDTVAVAAKQTDPKDQAVTAGLTVALSWSKVDAPVELQYVYEVATDPDFANRIDTDGNPNNGLQPQGFTTGTSVVVTGLASGMQYWWRVKILTAGGNPISGMWSAKLSFTPELGGPSLESPSYGAENVALRPTFSWQGITGADGYELQMASNQFFAMPETKGPLSHTTWTWEEDLTFGTTYYWRVRAIKGGATFSPWSESVFTIKTEPVPEKEAIVIQQAPAQVVPTIVLPQPVVNIPAAKEPAPSPITPAVIWGIIIIGAILVIAVIVLIVRTRRVP